jgi:myo-inositol-1(or 4)-monophosphatase
MTDGLTQRAAFAQHLADIAGGVIRPWFRRRIEVSDKGAPGFYDPVSEADRKAEDVIRAAILRDFPQDGIIGEEYGAVDTESEFVWVIDPIDGTRAFLAGQPLWGTLIALEADGRAVLGILDQPFMRERFTGQNGVAELRNAEGATALAVRSCERLSDAVICTTNPMTHMNEAERALFHRVERECRFSRYGGDCYAYALLAMGFIDLVIEAGLKHWDIAAVGPIVEGAGGLLTDWKGNPFGRGGDVIAAGDPRVHAAAVKILSG